jgi:diguanylate cyclase (GGDEF)-like protein/PAS domain S-box-containing protein
MKIVAKPMNKLNSKISSLDFSNLKQIDLKLFYENELSRFLRTLNILIKRLQSHHADLEKKVKERTEDLKIKNLELKLSNNKLESFSKIINQYIISSVTDIHGNIIEVSDAFCKISGYSRDELLGNNLNMLKNVDSTSCEDIIVSLNENKVLYGELKSKKKNGEYYWVDATITPIFDENNNKIGYTFIRQDITDKKVIEKLSITDGLTAIYNRRYFNELFPKVLASSKRDKELISFLIMDIDFFKQYNDTYGHQMGDEVLVKLARVLKNSLNRVDDYCFRIGGEEFALLFRSETKEHALNFANKIRQDIENLKIDHEQNTASRYVTVSMGLVTKNSQNILDTEAIYKEADDLLYKAKRAGKNQVFF